MSMKQCLLLLLLFLLSAGALAEPAVISTVPEEVFLPDGSQPAVSQSSYRSENVSISISTLRANKSDVYVADIYVRSVSSFRRAFAGDGWGDTTAKISSMAASSGALIAMTGDSSQNFSVGWVVGNGEVLRSTKNTYRDICLLYNSGELVTIPGEEIDHALLAAQAEEIWQCFLFGPALLDSEGRALTDFEDSSVRYTNPRSVIGYYEPGHYCFVQVDGRGTKSALESGATSQGMTLAELAAFMESLGCASAYNLDGGQSSMLWYDGEIISTPFNGGRSVGDIVFICEAE